MRAVYGTIIAFLLLGGVSRAEFVKLSFSEFVIAQEEQFRGIAEHHDLGERETLAARRTALVYVFVGPCRGSVTPQSEKLSQEQFAAVELAIGAYDPANQFVGAVRAMIGVLILADLGRGPTEYACRLAAESVGTIRTTNETWRYCFQEGREDRDGNNVTVTLTCKNAE